LGWGAIYRLNKPSPIETSAVEDCLEQIVLSTDVGEEAEPGQHEVGILKLARLI